MGLHPIDGYLLDGSPSKEAAIAAVLAEGSPVERAGPFLRALKALGSKAADEALMALRLTLANRAADDDAIRAMRGQLIAAKAGDSSARAAYLASVVTS